MTSRGTGAVLALHWQVNVIKPEGFFGGMLSEPVARSGVVARAVRFCSAARQAGAELVFTRFTIPEGEGGLVRNTESGTFWGRLIAAGLLADARTQAATGGLRGARAVMSAFAGVCAVVQS